MLQILYALIPCLIFATIIDASICIILTIVKNKNKLKVYLIYMLNGCTNSND